MGGHPADLREGEEGGHPRVPQRLPVEPHRRRLRPGHEPALELRGGVGGQERQVHRHPQRAGGAGAQGGHRRLPRRQDGRVRLSLVVRLDQQRVVHGRQGHLHPQRAEHPVPDGVEQASPAEGHRDQAHAQGAGRAQPGAHLRDELGRAGGRQAAEGGEGGGGLHHVARAVDEVHDRLVPAGGAAVRPAARRSVLEHPDRQDHRGDGEDRPPGGLAGPHHPRRGRGRLEQRADRHGHAGDRGQGDAGGGRRRGQQADQGDLRSPAGEVISC